MHPASATFPSSSVHKLVSICTKRQLQCTIGFVMAEKERLFVKLKKEIADGYGAHNVIREFASVFLMDGFNSSRLVMRDNAQTKRKLNSLEYKKFLQDTWLVKVYHLLRICDAQPELGVDIVSKIGN